MNSNACRQYQFVSAESSSSSNISSNNNYAFTADASTTTLITTRFRSSVILFGLPLNQHQSDFPDKHSAKEGRRQFLQLLANTSTLYFGAISLSPKTSLAAASESATIPTALGDLLPILQKARAQLDIVPELIQAGKWDSIRAILITPPISDCWSKQSKLLLNTANAIGNELPDGDELAALEAREDAVSHIRYLDMAVYNNNFNPIGVEGENGATKELIRSYYEDPLNELNASKNALDELISLSSR